MWYYVYVLQCADGKHYVGYTKNFRDRIRRHRCGVIRFTSTRLPVEIKAVIAVPAQYVAIHLEDYLKTGSGRAFTARHLFKHSN